MVSANYGYVLISSALMSFQVLLFGFIFPGRVRGRVFNKEFLETHFGKLHKDQIGTQITQGGPPDMGSGVYSQKLSYHDWYDFNNAQRVHLNFVEWIATQLILLLIGGLYFPQLAAALGFACILGRTIYGIGYQTKGPSGRSIGVLITDSSVLTLFILSMISSIYWILAKPF